MSTQYDIVVAGGGMVGASLASALAPLDLRLAVVEAFAPGSGLQPSYDDRVTAISNGSRQILDSIGIWPAVAEKATPIRQIHVSDRGRMGFSHLHAREEKVDALGYVVANRHLGEVLWSRLQSETGIDVLCPAKLKQYFVRDGLCELGIESDAGERGITSRLLIAADGARSHVRKMAGIGTTAWDYGQSAVVANVTPNRKHNNIAYERFTDGGPMALLPMGDGRCALVLTVLNAEVDKVLAFDDDEFIRYLQDRFGNRLGRFERVGKRQSYPLALIRADKQVAERLVIIGNAAHGLHPIAGQGFNLSLRDIATLAEVIADSMREENVFDPGNKRILDAYSDWRRQDQAKTIAFTDGLVRIFSNPLLPVRLARNAGLLLFDILPGAKTVFARHTMGKAGRLPRLARGLSL